MSAPCICCAAMNATAATPCRGSCKAWAADTVSTSSSNDALLKVYDLSSMRSSVFSACSIQSTSQVRIIILITMIYARDSPFSICTSSLVSSCVSPLFASGISYSLRASRDCGRILVNAQAFQCKRAAACYSAQGLCTLSAVRRGV